MAIGPSPVAPDVVAQKLADLDNVPLFMRDALAAESAEDNATIAALQSLVHDGSPDGGYDDGAC